MLIDTCLSGIIEGARSMPIIAGVPVLNLPTGRGGGEAPRRRVLRRRVPHGRREINLLPAPRDAFGEAGARPYPRRVSSDSAHERPGAVGGRCGWSGEGGLVKVVTVNIPTSACASKAAARFPPGCCRVQQIRHVPGRLTLSPWIGYSYPASWRTRHDPPPSPGSLTVCDV